MFGKSKERIKLDLLDSDVLEAIESWAEECELVKVESSNTMNSLYRFGSPFLSNPIYIELNLENQNLTITGWVQTLIPVFCWKLVESSREGLGTKIDYRRKGGYFVFLLKKVLSKKVK